MNKAVSDIINIDPTLTVPVYKQIVQSIIHNIENGTLGIDDLLPSVNKIAEAFSLARGSVFTAYNDLRASGIIDSVPGKGYYIASIETKQNKRIFLLYNTFSHRHAMLYEAVLKYLPKFYTIDVFFYNNNYKTFESLIRQQAGYYHLFLIMPVVNENTPGILSQLDPKAVLLLETGYKEYRKNFAGVYQNVEKDLYASLVKRQDQLAGYKRLVLVTGEGATLKDLQTALNKFTKKAAIASSVQPAIVAEEMQQGDAYIVTNDNDLVTIVHNCKLKKWKIGKDIGVLSYNETNLKSVIAEGITTITPDYEAMGKAMVEMITSRRREAIENSCILIDRNSL